MSYEEKKINSVFFLVFLADSFMFAQSAADLFKQANELREKGQGAEAVELYLKVKALDKSYETDCDYWIERISKVAYTDRQTLKLSITNIDIPYQGGVYEVRVSGAKSWSASCDEDWIRLNKTGDILNIECVEKNHYTMPRYADIEVVSGNAHEIINVTNGGAPEYLFVSSNIIYFSAEGGLENITIESNGVWDVGARPSWCEVQKNAEGITVELKPNSTPYERDGEIMIISPSGLTSTISVSQYEKEQILELSKRRLHFLSSGGTDTIKVRSTADTWRIADYPYWCNVKMETDSTIVAVCAANDLVEQYREGGIKIFTGSTYVNVDVYQDQMPAPVYIPVDKIVAGRNISFGISAGYVLPVVSAKASSRFVASAVNYSLGDNREQADYKTVGGYTAGAYADIRLFRNLYLTAGVGYTNYSYENLFDENYTRRINWIGDILEGQTDNQYRETYGFNMIDVPVSFSYRFPIDDLSFISINAGPTLSCFYDSKMQISGNTFSPYMGYVDLVGGVEPWSYSLDGSLDLLNAEGEYTELHTMSSGSSVPIRYPSMISAAPYKKVNWGATLSMTYEFRGIAIEIEYYHMLNNMANAKFWESERFEIFTFGSDVLMSGYRQCNNRLMINLNYTFRYKKL